MCEKSLDVIQSLHITISDYRDSGMLFNLCDCIPIGSSFITLGTGPAMNGHQRTAILSDGIYDLQVVELVIVPAEADLRGDRDGECGG